MREKRPELTVHCGDATRLHEADLDVLRGGKEIIQNDRPILMIELNKTTMEMAGWRRKQLGEFLEGMNCSFSTEKDQSSIMEAKKLKEWDLVKRVTDV